MTYTAPTLMPTWLVRKRTTIGLVLLLALLPVLMFIHHSWQEESLLDYLFDGGGYLLITLGILGRLWCTLYIGGRKHTELQTQGPYNIVRHPLYLSNLLLALGFSIRSENPAVLLIVILYFVVQYLATIRYEEAALRRTFGAAYHAYVREVPCFLPRFRRITLTSPAAIDYRFLRVETMRALLFVGITMGLEMLSLLHEKDILPHIVFP